MLVVFGVISMALMGAGYQKGYGSIITWFYGEDGNYSYSPFYLNSVFLVGGFFVISILYYFTRVRYRSLGVMLCILFPFVIYAKRAEEIPEALVTIIITLYLAVMVHNHQDRPRSAARKGGQGSRKPLVHHLDGAFYIADGRCYHADKQARLSVEIGA